MHVLRPGLLQSSPLEKVSLVLHSQNLYAHKGTVSKGRTLDVIESGC